MPFFKGVQTLFQRRLLVVAFLLLLVATVVAASLFLYRDHQRDVRVLLDRSLSALAISWEAVQGQQRYSVATCFEEYVQDPDVLGLAVGDQLLIELARRMTSVSRVVDTLARLGGDEFVAVLSDLDNEQAAEMLADRLLERTSSSVLIEGVTFQGSGRSWYCYVSPVSVRGLTLPFTSMNMPWKN